MKKFLLAFKLWCYIAGMMSLVIFVSFLLFMDIMQYTNYFYYMKEIFIGTFITVIVISFFVVNFYFDLFGIEIKSKNKFIKYLKVYFGILWRALIILIPIIGFIAYKYHGSIESRIITIIIEIIAGLPAIWWFLQNKNIKIKN